ncbi:MAG TPA: NAD-glutamate dehydrogenase, partial [Lapillicoccus sp.]|nr:NAD-glutamate dehydrogenase [Lapillicoccus sp.]
MSASLEQSRTQQLRAAAEYAPDESRTDVTRLLHVFYRHAATEDLLAREPEDLLGAVLAERDLARERAVGTVNVAVTNPSVEDQGWTSGHTIVQVVTDDMPFLVDSVTAALGTVGRTVHLVVHPQLVVRRDAVGTLEHVYDDDAPAPDEFGVVTESWMHLEIDRVGAAEEREEISARLQAVLGNVRDAIEDWGKMKERCISIATSLHEDPPKGIEPEEVGSTARFLEWLSSNHFNFLGYREYTLEVDDDGEDLLAPVSGTGLGILRYDKSATEPVARLNPSARKKAREPELLIITKANSRATVHRDAYLDYIGVKVFDDQGHVTGERRFLGIFASSAYAESILHIPILAERVEHLLERAGFTRDSHSGKDLVQVMENYPRDELLQTDPDDLLEIATSVLHLQERRKTKLFLRYDVYERFVSALIYLPRDRYNTTVRLKMEEILRRAFDADNVDYTTR